MFNTNLGPETGSILEATPMTARYQVLPSTAPVPAPDDGLEMIVRQGAQRMIQAALSAEIDEFLGRLRYERTSKFRGYRNGYLPARTIGTGMGTVDVRQPRVSSVPAGLERLIAESLATFKAFLSQRGLTSEGLNSTMSIDAMLDFLPPSPG